MVTVCLVASKVIPPYTITFACLGAVRLKTALIRETISIIPKGFAR